MLQFKILKNDKKPIFMSRWTNSTDHQQFDQEHISQVGVEWLLCKRVRSR